jgi:hypothetical protein
VIDEPPSPAQSSTAFGTALGPVARWPLTPQRLPAPDRRPVASQDPNAAE